MNDATQKYIIVAVVLLAGMGSTTFLVANERLDANVFSVVVGGAVTGILAWLNAPSTPSAPRP